MGIGAPCEKYWVVQPLKLLHFHSNLSLPLRRLAARPNAAAAFVTGRWFVGDMGQLVRSRAAHQPPNGFDAFKRRICMVGINILRVIRVLKSRMLG